MNTSNFHCLTGDILNTSLQKCFLSCPFKIHYFLLISFYFNLVLRVTPKSRAKVCIYMLKAKRNFTLFSTKYLFTRSDLSKWNIAISFKHK